MAGLRAKAFLLKCGGQVGAPAGVDLRTLVVKILDGLTADADLETRPAPGVSFELCANQRQRGLELT